MCKLHPNLRMDMMSLHKFMLGRINARAVESSG